MHELVKCVYFRTQPNCSKVVCHIISLSQDFCEDSLKLHFGRHGIVTDDVYQKMPVQHCTYLCVY